MYTPLAKDLLLLRALNLMRKANPVFSIKLHANLPKVRSTCIKTTRLNTSHIWHDLQLSIQTAATGRAEEVLVDLSRIANCVVSFEGSNNGRVAFGDVEGSTWNDDVRSVGAAGPLLAIGTMAKCCYRWLSCAE
jgi:hypothetical protein